MKPLLTWAELTPAQQEYARQYEYQELLRDICENGCIASDPTIQAGIDAAWAECERLRTPWFFAEAVHEKVGDLLMQFISTFVQQMHYKNPDTEEILSTVALPSAKEPA